MPKDSAISLRRGAAQGLARFDAYMKHWVMRHSMSSESTGETYADAIKRVMTDILKVGGLGAVSSANVGGLLNDWKDRMSTNTLNVTLSALSVLWEDAKGDGLQLGENPWKHIRRKRATPHVIERVLTEQEMKRVINVTAPGRNRLFVRFLYTTGLRVSEALSVRWQDFSLSEDGETVYCTVTGKGSKQRTVRILPYIWEDLRDYRAGAKRDAKLWPFTRTTAWRIVHNAQTAAGLLDHVLSPHVLRHSHATHAIEHGASILDVQANLGHARLDTTQIYVNLRPGPRSEAFLPKL